MLLSLLKTVTATTSRMAHLPNVLLLLVLLHVIPKASSEICFSETCYYTLEISQQFSHIVDTDDGDYFDFTLVPGTKNLQIINSTFRPGVEDPIGTFVPNPLDVVTLDGIRRKVYTINGQFPGPTLEFGVGSKIVITVINKLDDDVVSIHWHGFLQAQNAWFDGVPQLTQCPIPPGSSFTYRMNASHVGTFWFHSHVAYQTMDGLSGPIIIHPKWGPTHPYFPVLVQDWYHADGSDYFFANARSAPAASGLNLWRFNEDLVDGSGITTVRYVSGLINGRGRFVEDELWPLSRFEVRSSDTYRFHIIHIGSQSPLQVSVDSHKLFIVGVDGREVDSIPVDSVIIYTGERVVAELKADQPIGRYWIRSRLANDETVTGFFRETLAILEYEGLGTDDEPTTNTKICTSTDRCTVFNCPFKYYPPSFYSNCIPMKDAQRTYTPEERHKYGLNQLLPDVEHFVNIRSNRGHKFNGRDFIPPTSPVYQKDCETVSCKDCVEDEICDCTTIIDLPYDKVIQFVISNIPTGGVNVHPIHFHGHDFAVVDQGFPDYEYLGYRNVTKEIECNNDLCSKPKWASGGQPVLNLHDPPLKDTVVIAAGGYTVVRFRSDNPGPWLVHCHMANHIVQGNVVFLIMEARERFPPIPVKMPTCTRNFSLTDYEYEKYVYAAQRSLVTGEGFQKVPPGHTIPIPPPTPSPRPPPMCPRPPIPPRGNKKGEVTMNIGGVVGTVVAAFLGGFLTNLIIVLICRCCCHGRTPMENQRRHTGKKTVVLPGPPTYIGTGPVATYGAPVKPISYY